MARRAAGRMVGVPPGRRPAGATTRPPSTASEEWTAAQARARGDGPTRRDPEPPRHVPAGDWVRVDELREEATGAVGRGGSSRRTTRGGARTRGSSTDPGRGARRSSGSERAGAPAPNDTADADLRTQLVRAVGADRGARLEKRVKEASRAYRSERYPEARATLSAIAREAPTVVAVRELLGLTLYRMGRWKPAVEQLEAFRQMTGSTEQNPVLADCYRALRRYDKVDELWEELRAVSPDADLVMEGRIVAAGALADRGDLRGAIALLESSGKATRRPQERHLRRAYALGDLYERTGDVPRAREWFRFVAEHDPEFVDVRQRIRLLG